MRWRPFAVVLVAGCCATVVASSAAGSPERVIAALLLALVLPGLSIVEAISRSSGGTETLLLALGASIAVLILDSGVLYVLGVPLGSASWAWSLVAITVLGAIKSMLRPASRGGRSLRERAVASRASLPAVSICVALVAGALAAAVLVTQQSVAHRVRSDHFTQLWVLPAGSGTGRITVGLYNHQGRDQRYRLEIRRHGRPFKRQTVHLRAGERWAKTISGLPARGPVRVSAVSAGPEHVHRWVRIHLHENSTRLTNPPSS